MTTSRQDLKAVLQPIVGPGVQVYAFPPDSLKGPAVTIEGADPWIVDSMTGGTDRPYRMFYTVKLWQQRTTVSAAYNKVESLALKILNGLTNERWKAAEVSAIETEAHGNVEYAVAEIVVSARLEAQ
jgi:hypothetical protein